MYDILDLIIHYIFLQSHSGADRLVTVMKEITDEYGEKTTRAKQMGMILSI
jgi:hypothetical protein